MMRGIADPVVFHDYQKVITQGGIVTYASDRTRGVDHGISPGLL